MSDEYGVGAGVVGISVGGGWWWGIVIIVLVVVGCLVTRGWLSGYMGCLRIVCMMMLLGNRVCP